MTQAKRHLWDQARQLRAQGLSIRQIQKQIPASKSSISEWVRDISFEGFQPKPSVTIPRPLREDVPIKRDTYNWQEIQDYYDQVRSLKKCAEHFNLSHSMLDRSIKAGRLRTYYQGIPISNMLIENSPHATLVIKRRIFSAGLKQRQCEQCSITTWRGKPISFQVHHKNGINNDHRLKNIEILCPNCHSQTDTYTGKNKSAALKRKPYGGLTKNG